MCAGVWSDDLHEKFGIKPGYKVAMSKGAHIVLPKSAIKSDAGIILKTSVSVLFIIPWADKWIVGTTDTPYKADRTNPVATKEDVEYIIDQANRVLHPKIDAADILGVYAGLRPLVANAAGSTTTKLSREHTVDRPVPGFVSIAGGKYTTYRVMGKDVIDLAVNDLRRIVAESITEKLPAIGADGYFALVQQSAQLAQMSGLTEPTITHLLDRYGSLINEIFEIIDADVREGTRRDAMMYALSANSTNGQCRSPDDKRKAVMTVFDDLELSEKSDREIAKMCAVSHVFVSKLRKAAGKQPETIAVSRGDQEFKINNPKKEVIDAPDDEKDYIFDELTSTVQELAEENKVPENRQNNDCAKSSAESNT
jgi:glycerol-3-phosphate dehydrogenase